MIQANELRLGNWVTFCHPKTEYNIQIPAYDIYLCSIGDRAYKGIPLTPEILEKAGFVKEQYYYFDKARVFMIYQTSHMLNEYEFSKYLNSVWNIVSTVKYLHELQNLYYCLTGKELEIKL